MEEAVEDEVVAGGVALTSWAHSGFSNLSQHLSDIRFIWPQWMNYRGPLSSCPRSPPKSRPRHPPRSRPPAAIVEFSTPEEGVVEDELPHIATRRTRDTVVARVDTVSPPRICPRTWSPREVSNPERNFVTASSSRYHCKAFRSNISGS